MSRKGPSFAYCTLCSYDVSIAYGGTKDLRKHEQTALHQSASRSVAGTSSPKTYFPAQSSGPKRELATIEAEIKFPYFIGEHHLALALADHCSQLFPSLFPDSPIARSFRRSRTKATAVVKVVAQKVM